MSNLAKLQTNIPRCGTISAVYYAPTKKAEYSDQIKVVGHWEAEGAGAMWLALPILKAFTDAGLVQQVEGQTDSDGRPKLAVISTQQRVMIVKKEVGGNKKQTEVCAINGLGQVVTLPAQPYPSCLNQPTPTAAAAAPAPIAASTVAPGAVAPPAPGVAAAPAPTAPAVATVAAAPPEKPSGNGGKLSGEELKKRAQQGWGELSERHSCSLAISARNHLRLARVLNPKATLSDIPLDVIHAGAATVLIESSRQVIPAVAGQAAALWKRLEEELAGKPDAADARGVGAASQDVEKVGQAQGAPKKKDKDDYDGFDPNEEEDDDLPF